MPHPITRAERRNAVTRAKSKARRKLSRWHFPVTPSMVGKAAAVHNRGCSCWMCSYKDDYAFDARSVDSFRAGLDELHGVAIGR